MTPVRYSPLPIESYSFSAKSQILTEDPDAWNLAYLSWDFETCQRWPDPNFSTHVRRTLQFVPTTGKLDLAGSEHIRDTVRWMVRNPAPRVVKLLLAMPRFKELPLYQAYGDTWAETILARSFLYREPDDQIFDVEINDVSLAMTAIRLLRSKQ
ncbi:hypothetical protein [Rhodoferax fermentans]|jgi:hypothetical protein|uniref:Uncharacterized protein n=1 Tax=Rhodoferax fermentans TaxID=28066 RepID=A0A1T1AMP0_RHOFE|nr:hypothetical protein [Rhodoferax fermentans]MBK1683931.1 hypothetical protein [Rhodoferax fermentans]OOV05360.1 hypothetical protein RF819_00330 [Rhodoferax fermentans]